MRVVLEVTNSEPEVDDSKMDIWSEERIADSFISV